MKNPDLSFTICQFTLIYHLAFSNSVWLMVNVKSMKNVKFETVNA